MIELRDIPPEPQVPDCQRGTGRLPLRYEDITQDGRLRLEPVTQAVGVAVWQQALATHPIARQLTDDQILPILSRLQIESGGGPVPARDTVEAYGSFQLVRTADDSRVRLRVDMWSEIRAALGHTHGPAPAPDAPLVPVARMLAEHVLTRPFGDAENRQVDAIPRGLPEGMSMHDAKWQPPTQVLQIPPGATAIDDSFALDPSPIVFGLGHTDSNQHVNSLVYPRLLEEAALRRFHSLGLPTTVFARYVDLRFRKPCFAGDRMRIMLRAYRLGSELGVVAAFITAGEAITAGTKPSDRAHCYARLQLTA